MTTPNIKELVKDNFVKFDRFRAGNFYYILRDGDQDEYEDYEFIIPLDDVQGVTLEAEDKAITMMRWIRKSIENKTFRMI